MSKVLRFSELPKVIQSVLGSPRNLYRATQPRFDKIVLRLTYDDTPDVWRLINGKWEYENPGK